jgi:acyl-coenzyme A thioesterase PaaI-like protein
MADEEIDAHELLRREAAAALRDLLHSFVGHEHSDDQLAALRDWARRATTGADTGAIRNRTLLMERARDSARPGEWQPSARAGFEDRAVAGRANPTSLVIDWWRDGDSTFADITFQAAFEGAPARAHGGIVAAAFDDFTGAIIGTLGEPAFTGELTVRFVRPVPVHRPLRFRTWLDSRDGRKLHIHADAHDGDELVATCRAIYITVDPSVFAHAPDPR